ncbi:hypothetical protein [Marisediminicola senii]|uniref:hypothetical protein n=1 Tax=Marisediminicola senii TaxID=2711233 RepID=UPI0013EB8A1D|nr:hypothetical protein [Marisediminicola senii]
MTVDETLDTMTDAWAGRHGLRRDPGYSGRTTLQPLFTATTEQLVADASTAHLADQLLVNSRAFKAIGALRNSVMVSAPIERTLLRHVGPPARIVEQAWALAEAVGLRVRIGNPLDRVYDERIEGVFVPMVWWDPERIALPYAPLA